MPGGPPLYHRMTASGSAPRTAGAALLLVVLLAVGWVPSGAPGSAPPRALLGFGHRADPSAALAAFTAGAPPPSSSPWVNRTLGSGPVPPPRWGAMAAYDASDGYLVLYGGIGNSHGALKDTWTWADGRWTNRTATVGTAPPARYLGAMAYDPGLGGLLLFGGIHAGSELADDWEFTGGHWTALAVNVSPPALAGASLVDDAHDHELVLFGGINGTGVDQASTWTFAAGRWVNRTASLGTAPPPLAYAGACYDPGLAAVVLFGGIGSKRPLNETWGFTGGNWTNRTATSGAAPPARGYPGFACDAVDGFDVLFGGYQNSQVFNDTWTYRAGEWAPSQPPSAPTPRNAMVLTYTPGPSPGNATVVMFAGRSLTASSSTSYGDSWTYKLPLAANILLAPSAFDAGGSTTISLVVAGGYPPYADSWSGLPSNCPGPAIPGNFSCTPPLPGSWVISAVVTDSVNATVTTRSVNLTVNAAPSIGADAQPSVGESPLRVTFTSTVTGGTRPYYYLWDFGDGNRSISPNPWYVYTSAGAYTARVQLTDGSGAVATSPGLAIEVSRPLSLVAFGAPLVGVVPLRVNFTAQPADGDAPYTYAWSFGVAGATDTVADPSFTYTVPGVYAVSVTVTDQVGIVAHQSFNVTALQALSADFTVSYPGGPVCSNGTVSTFVQLTAVPRGGIGPFTEQWTVGAQLLDGPAPGLTLPGGSYLPVNLTISDSRGDRASTSAGLRVPTTGCGVFDVSTGVSGGTLALAEVAAGILMIVILVEGIVLVRGRRDR